MPGRRENRCRPANAFRICRPRVQRRGVQISIRIFHFFRTFPLLENIVFDTTWKDRLRLVRGWEMSDRTREVMARLGRRFAIGRSSWSIAQSLSANFVAILFVRLAAEAAFGGDDEPTASLTHHEIPTGPSWRRCMGLSRRIGSLRSFRQSQTGKVMSIAERVTVL